MTTLLPLAISDALRDWLDLGLRWLHVIAAMAWIGTSFYFVLLDQSLRPAKDPVDREAGVGGELWEVHGGGFYHVQKYVVAPRRLPEHLAWFKWEAYTTWLSGFGLMIVLYYLEASSTLVKPGSDLDPWLVVAISIALLATAWIAYDVLNRLVTDPRVLWPALFVLVALAAWGSWELFTPRAAWLQVGAMIGTVMAANVFVVIIPAHWELIHAKQAGREPDPAAGDRGRAHETEIVTGDSAIELDRFLPARPFELPVDSAVAGTEADNLVSSELGQRGRQAVAFRVAWSRIQLHVQRSNLARDERRRF